MSARRFNHRGRNRRTSGLNLLLGVNKPYGEVTRAIDNFVGNVLQDDGVGHIGTLDPAVTGVVVLGVGQARKLIPRIEDGKRKAYAARIAFGTQTDTDDAEGRVIREAASPHNLLDSTYGNEVLSSFVGRIMQRPPNYSAVKVDGVRAYDRARAGEVFELPPREVEVFEATLRAVVVENGVVMWDCDFVVSTGTYIRALARDLGEAVEGAAHLASLCRTASGLVALADCTTLQRIEELGPEGVRSVALDPVKVLGYPFYVLDERELAGVQNGRAFRPRKKLREGFVSLVHGSALYGVWNYVDGFLRPETNCPQGVDGVRVSPLQDGGNLWQGIPWAPLSCPPVKDVNHEWGVVSTACDHELDSTTSTVVVLGAFDGLHVGHQALLQSAKADARKRGVPCMAVTFDPDPAEVVGLNNTAQRLLSTDDRRAGILVLGMDCVVTLHFDQALASVSPEEFVQKICGIAQPVSVHVGKNFRFGRGASGDVDVLRELGERHGFNVIDHELMRYGSSSTREQSTPTSATRVRELLRGARLDEANELLGRCHYVRGTVIRGRGEATSFGFPTANIACDVRDCLPAEGVYACYVTCGDTAWPAAVNVGAPPTFSDPVPAFMEANLLGFNGNLYNAQVSVSFVKWLRASRPFSSIDELTSVVLGNIDWVRQHLGDHAVGVDA